MSTYLPIFSRYVRLGNGTEVGIHKFVIDENDPPASNTITWEVKQLSRHQVQVGQLVALNNAQAGLFLSVTAASSDSNNTTASVTLTKAQLLSMSVRGDRNPHELYFVTFHDRGSVNTSTFRVN